MKVNNCRCGATATLLMGEGVHGHVLGCDSDKCGEVLVAPYYDTGDMLTERWNKTHGLSKEKNKYGNFIHCL